MSAFAVPAEQQPKALTIGIVIALGLRAMFIALGAALLAAFTFMFLVFGLMLIGTAVQLFRHRDGAGGCRQRRGRVRVRASAGSPGRTLPGEPACSRTLAATLGR